MENNKFDKYKLIAGVVVIILFFIASVVKGKPFGNFNDDNIVTTENETTVQTTIASDNSDENTENQNTDNSNNENDVDTTNIKNTTTEDIADSKTEFESDVNNDNIGSKDSNTSLIVNDDYKEYYFRTKKLLDSHYEKHGKEMGFKNAKEYEKAASDVVNNKSALHKTESEDGDDVYYIESTNEFVIVSTDGYIRTYFNPSGGIDYYNRQ